MNSLTYLKHPADLFYSQRQSWGLVWRTNVHIRRKPRNNRTLNVKFQVYF
jgi:hypothetical protein